MYVYIICVYDKLFFSFYLDLIYALTSVYTCVYMRKFVKSIFLYADFFILCYGPESSSPLHPYLIGSIGNNAAAFISVNKKKLVYVFYTAMSHYF